MTNFFVIGDIHIKLTNFDEIDNLTEKLLSVIGNPDFVVILGDILDTHEKVNTMAMNKACDFFEKFWRKYKTYVLVGNHDAINNQIFLSDNHWMRSLKNTHENLVIVDDITFLETNGELFTFCPYVFAGRFEEALNTGGEKWKKSSVIFAHQEIRGCKMGGIISKIGDVWGEDYPYLISGHIHLHQQLQKNVFYVGSSLQLAYGESEENIAISLDVDGGVVEITEHPLSLPRKKILTSSLDDLVKLKRNKEDDVRLVLTGTLEEFKMFKKSETYKELLKEKNTKVSFKPKVEEKFVGLNFDFMEILTKRVEEEKDEGVKQALEMILREN